jgi:hypothetical protein
MESGIARVSRRVARVMMLAMASVLQYTQGSQCRVSRPRELINLEVVFFRVDVSKRDPAPRNVAFLSLGSPESQVVAPSTITHDEHS